MKAEQFEQILQHIENQGKSLRESCILEGFKSTSSFFKFLEKGEEGEKKEKREQYAYAMSAREDKIFDEIISIADHTEEDHTPFTGSNVVQRDKLRIDARKWKLGKMNPKKYGDKVDLGVGDLPKDSKVSINLSLGSNEGNK